jgi:RNA polymerase sigma factor for flagellar operon FliA
VDTAAGPVEDQTPSAPQDLWQRYHGAGDTPTEDALIRQYLPLVRTVVGPLAMTPSAQVSAEDLQSAARVGLLQAIRSFDAKGGASFPTFARFRIRGAALDELRRMDWVPRLVHDRARKIQDALGELEQRLGAPPSEPQMAEALGLTLGDYRSWLDEIRPVALVRLDAVSNGDTADETTPHECIADDSQEDPFERASRSDLKALIAKRIRQLPPIQRKVLALYYYEDLRLREIAEVFGLTESRISQIHAKAILAIRRFIERHEAMAVPRGKSPH